MARVLRNAFFLGRSLFQHEVSFTYPVNLLPLMNTNEFVLANFAFSSFGF